MKYLLQRRDLGFAGSLAAAVIVAAALFAWIDSSTVVSDSRLNVDSWAWKIWQLAALPIAVPGVWWLWRNTRSLPSVWAIVLTAFAVVVFINLYGDHSSDFSASPFGDNTQTVWECINALVVGLSAVAALGLWRGETTVCRIGALLVAVFGIVDLINADFLQNGTIWQILDPLIILAALIWAANEVRPGGSPAEDA